MVAPRPWGWHQLKPQWADSLVAEAALPRNALVLDVGAGAGAVTEPLLRAGARVIAIEAHPGRARRLRQRFGGEIIVIEADGAALRLPTRPYHVVSNPPFGISAPLLRRLLQPGSRLVSARLVLQDGAARRWASRDAPGARRWRAVFDARAGHRVPCHAFVPPPRATARVLEIDRRAN